MFMIATSMRSRRVTEASDWAMWPDWPEPSMHQMPMTLRTEAMPISGRWRRRAARMRTPREATKT